MPSTVPASFPVPSRSFVRHGAFPVVCAFLAFLVPVLLFFPARQYGFIALDDGSYVLHNPIVSAGLSWQTFRQAFAFPGPAPMYLPVLWLSYMLDVSLLGAGPAVPGPFHLVNTVLHALDTLLLFALFLRLSRRAGPSLLLALLWALHPLRIESVAWIAERKDTLSLLFLLLSIHAWIAFLRSPGKSIRTASWALSFLSFTLGLLVKPSIMPLPFLMAALALPPCSDRIPSLAPAVPLPAGTVPRFKALLKTLWPFFLLALAAARLSVITHAADNDVIPVPFISRLLTIPSVAAFYLSKTICPTRLSLIYPSWISRPLPGLLGLVLLLAAAVVLFRQRHRVPFLWLGGLFAALFLAPVSGIVQVPFNLVADRFSYLPSIGLSLVLLGLFSALPVSLHTPSPKGLPSAGRVGETAKSPLAVFSSLLLVLLLAAETVLSARHLPVWKDTRSIYATVRPYLPDHYAVRIHDAQETFRRGRFDDALECLRRATAAAGRLESADVAAALPVVWARDGDQAALDFLRNTPIPPSDSLHSGWCYHLALVHLTLGHFREALDIASSSLPGVPAHDLYRQGLMQIAMVAAHSLGLHPLALAHASRIGLLAPGETVLDPSRFSSFYIELWHHGFRNAAIPYFRSILRDYPSAETFNNISWLSAVAFWSPVSPEETLSWAQHALALEGPASPRRPGLLDTLAAAQANAGDFGGAVSSLSAALDATPPGHPSRPAMIRRLDLYRRGIPYRELQEQPVPESEYDYPVDFSTPSGASHGF